MKVLVIVSLAKYTEKQQEIEVTKSECNQGDYSLRTRIANQPYLPWFGVAKEIHLVKGNNERLVMEMNTGYHDAAGLTAYLKCITDQEIDAESVTVSLLLYTDYGKHITLQRDFY